MSLIVGYARVSSTEQSENSHALEQQRQRLVDNGVSYIIQDVKSGATARRKGLQELISLVKVKEIREVVITRIDRLTRNLTDLREFAQLCQANGVNLRILDQALDLSTPHGKMMLNMLGSLAEWERDLLIDRVNKGISHQQKELRVSGVVPFGYRRNKDGKYEPSLDLYKATCKVTWQVARHLVDIFLTVGTVRGTVREFELIYGTEESIKGRGVNVGKYPPGYIGLKYWLQNPVLRGHTSYYYRSRTLDTILTPNSHQCLIDDKEWSEIQRHLQIHERVKKRPDKEPLPLAGLVYCGLCGYRCKAFQKRTKKGLDYYWLCSKRYEPTAKCAGCKSIKNSLLEIQVISGLIERAEELANSINLDLSPLVDSPELLAARNSLSSMESLPKNVYLDEAITALRNQIRILELTQQEKNSVSHSLRDELTESCRDIDFWDYLKEVNDLRRRFRKFVLRVELVDSDYRVITFSV